MSLSEERTAEAVAVVGAGALGGALVRRLNEVGYRVEAVLSRSEAAARALGEQVEAPVASAQLSALPAQVRLLFCCVPDDVLSEVAEALSHVPHDWKATVVAHTSGALPASVLRPLTERGAAVMSFHPLQSFPEDAPSDAFEGIAVGLEGEEAALAMGEEVARALGARPVRLTAEAKPCYHLAAALASNGLVTLMAVATEVLASAGFDREEGMALLRPLVDGTWENLKTRLPEEALTGPVARGDRKLLDLHAETLSSEKPELMPFYAALSTETVRLALRAGRLTPEAAEGLLEQLHTALDRSAGAAARK